MTLAAFILGLFMGFFGACLFGASLAANERKKREQARQPKKQLDTDMIVKLFGEYLKNQESKNEKK